MTEKNNSNNRDWSTRVGTIKEGSVETFDTKDGKEALRAIVVNEDGKENIIEAFGDPAKEKLNAAIEAGVPFVFRGPAYFTQGNVSHVMIATANPKGEPQAKKELTEEEKAAKAEAARATAAEKDKTRVPVIEGSVAEGGTVSVGGADVAVTGLGRAWELNTEEKVAGLKARFPDVEGIEMGAKVQFANFEAPEAEEEMAGPGM